MMSADRTHVQGAEALDADADVVLGYPAERAPGAGPLHLGPGARLRSGTVLYAGSRIGARLSTGHHVVVREESVLGDDVSLWSNTYVDYGCRLGDGVKLHVGCYLAQYSTLEDDVFLAPGVVFTNDLYPGDPTSAQLMMGPCVRSGAQLGAGVTVLPFIEIGAGALIGAGSVVTHDLPAGVVAYGSPAQVVGSVDRLLAGQARLRARYDLRVGGGMSGDEGVDLGGRGR
jgi:acetyltransferase-like isoleucine patch superfamily enzyme